MDTTPVGAMIVERVAAREGVDPLELDVLHDVIDADALDALVDGHRGRQGGGLHDVKFAYHGYDVTVDGNGRVTVDERAAVASADESARDATGDD